ncbi:MAG: quinol:electron acceptor oxidoreductase subunit ActD, partial [Planctomycetota bacterium]
HGLVAEYTSVDTLLDACRRVRDAGYKKTDAFAPFPVHGIDKALGIKPTILPWIVLACGLAGTTTGLAMQIWMNSIDYKYIISGKPYLSLPAFIPVAYELTILFASFGAFFGMWALNGLPRFSNPIFTDPRFDRATDDRFFLYIDAKDDKYDEGSIRSLFGETTTDYIQTVVDDDSSPKVPKGIFVAWAAVASFSVIPLLIVLKMRVTNSPMPRFHVFFDMDFSPAKDAQQTSTLFADGRAMRRDVPGTVARGEIFTDMDFMTGIDMDLLTEMNAAKAEQLVSTFNNPHFLQDDEEINVEKPEELEIDEPAPPTSESVMDTTPWLKKNPMPIDAKLLKQGKAQFEIYCAVCHGLNGGGNGLVNRRAQKILAATWIPPSKLNQPGLMQEVYPDGKMFSTISNGIRKMPGYSAQIKTKDRWAIVAYVRALQRSQNANIDQVPDEKREEILIEQEEVKQKLKEQAEAEAKAAEEAAQKN